jgi:hypothetical protein
MFGKLVSACLTVLLLLSMAMVFPVSASSTTYVSVINATNGYGVPGFYGTTTVNFTDTYPPPTATNYPLGYFLVNITVTDVTNLSGWQINVTWDPTLLQIRTEDDIYRNDTPTHYFAIFGMFGIETAKNVKPGKVYWAVSRGVGKPAFTGNGIICQIKFNIIQAPASVLTCQLHLDQVSSFPTKITDPAGDPILYTPQHGTYEYSVPPPPSLGGEFFVRPSEIINSSILPPQTIQINVTIKNVTNMYSYGFILGYDSNILICIGFTFLDVLGEPNYIPEFSVDNMAGVIKVNVTYYPPAVPITSISEVPLLKIIFRVKGRGATPLDIHDTFLGDSLGRPIPHVSHDGLFVNLIRDLAIINVVPYKNWTYQGNLLKINVTVQNKGEVIETSVDVKTYFDSNLIDTLIIPSLNPSEQTTVTFVWNTTSVTPCHNYTVSAEVLSVPFELHLEDNKLEDGGVKIRLPCDVNGDKKVDIDDLVLVTNAIPSKPGDPNWNEYADVNDDRLVDIGDLVRLLKMIGTSCS